MTYATVISTIEQYLKTYGLKKIEFKEKGIDFTNAIHLSNIWTNMISNDIFPILVAFGILMFLTLKLLFPTGLVSSVMKKASRLLTYFVPSITIGFILKIVRNLFIYDSDLQILNRLPGFLYTMNYLNAMLYLLAVLFGFVTFAIYKQKARKQNILSLIVGILMSLIFAKSFLTNSAAVCQIFGMSSYLYADKYIFIFGNTIYELFFGPLVFISYFISY